MATSGPSCSPAVASLLAPAVFFVFAIGVCAARAVMLGPFVFLADVTAAPDAAFGLFVFSAIAADV